MHEKNCLKLSSSCKYFFWCLLQSHFLRRQLKNFNYYAQSCCFRILLFLVPFIIQFSLDPFVERTSKSPIDEKLSRTTYTDPQVSEKLKNQLVWKINNAAFVHFREVSIFGHSIRCIKNWITFCYEISYSTKVSFFFKTFSR